MTARQPSVRGVCKTCGRTRMVRRPGPRCAECSRARKAAQSADRHAAHIGRTYDLAAEEYIAIKDFQGGVCAICKRSFGVTRRLSVDHDHEVERAEGTRASIRGVLCRPCNNMLGHLRDDPEAFRRAACYLEDPPARRVLRERRGG